MVNVAILTMGQARGLGIEGPLLREFGLAALMHDIGKVKTPTEILNKPDKLTDEDVRDHAAPYHRWRRDSPDDADIPALVPIVAFEHHLRLDGSGYPLGVSRPSLNLATMLCGIADVYDAMRSQRLYQKAFPSERIVAVLQRNDGTQFDQNLVRQVRSAPRHLPRRQSRSTRQRRNRRRSPGARPRSLSPKVRVLFADDGARLELPHDVNLWEENGHARSPVFDHCPAQPRRLRRRSSRLHLNRSRRTLLFWANEKPLVHLRCCQRDARVRLRAVRPGCAERKRPILCPQCRRDISGICDEPGQRHDARGRARHRL
jgi:hypothetical protein